MLQQLLLQTQSQQLTWRSGSIRPPSSSHCTAPGPLSPGIKSLAVLQVATWGVFKRPSNISEHYGGGRTIPAGTKLESEEQAAARKARMAAVLQRWAAAAMCPPPLLLGRACAASSGA